MSRFDEKLFPELLLFEPGKERRRMGRRVVLNLRTYGIFCALIAIYIFGVSDFLQTAMAHQGMPHWAVRVVSACIPGGLVLVAIRVTRRGIRRYLRMQLISKGVPVCMKCGYELQGQIEPRCPECGTRFDLKILKQDRLSDE